MVKVEIISSDTGSPEHYAAVQLKKMFEKTPEFSNAEGLIKIFVSFKCYGQYAEDIDLVVFGQFDSPYLPNLNLWSRTDKKYEMREHQVFVDNFCFTIEVKNQIPENISIEGNQVFVKYGTRPHPASSQSTQQKFSLKNYLTLHNGWTPYIVSILWLCNVDSTELSNLDPNKFTNTHVLPAQFDIYRMLNLACANMNIRKVRDRCFLTSTKKENKGETAFQSVHEAHRIFSEIKENTSLVTRKRLEFITQGTLKAEGSQSEQKFAKAIGEKLVIIQGKAGTGKTIRMLQIAYDLAVKRKKRCLILTYNKALIEDLRYHFRLIGKPELDPSGEVGVVIRSVMSFTRSLGIGFGCLDKWSVTQYDEYLDILLRNIQHELPNEKNRYLRPPKSKENLLFDVILVDEAQDWLEHEKNILYELYGSKSVVIVDGIDQLVRRTEKCDWAQGIDYNDTIKNGLRVSLRQKTNLIRFIRCYATKFNLQWDIEAKEDLPGGRIIVLASTNAYTREFHNEILTSAIKADNQPNDILILVGPDLVHKLDDERWFKLAESWEKKFGNKIWDGTSRKREEGDLYAEIPVYPRNVHECNRVVQYDSARGLEGWAVVCSYLDEFVQYKFEGKSDTSDIPQEKQLALLEADDDTRKQFAYKWTMIPLTRAMDTLVITIKDLQSEYAQKLKEVVMQCSDFAEWRE
ncbi:MAG: DUF2075 domain-containing protein [Candidatus Kapabacteria bacterium]|jgi:hypothetical protein|nr:DUF2075 domain-containing protein [Candidatus Kapabacteria bacterium]